MKLYILAASIVHQDPDVFAAFLRTVKWQDADVSLDLRIVIDPDDPNANLNAALAKEAGAEVAWAQPKPQGARYAVHEGTHDWSVPTFHWLAAEKQRLLDLTREARYDAIWLLDSDLLLSPATLSSLLSTRKEVVSGVFWTRWSPEMPPLPQVWRAHPYTMQGAGVEAHEFLKGLAERQVVEVGGTGACLLIRAAALGRVAYWPLLPDLPAHGMWQGEDRHFCVRAQRQHVSLAADAWPDIFHVYRPSDRTQIPARLEQLSLALRAPAIGDLVSLTLEPLEEPRAPSHVEHVRGRLGTLPLAPELENAVLQLAVGEEALVRVRFPYWHEIADYREQTRTIRVRLHGVKPWSLAPGLDDFPPASERGVAPILEPYYAATQEQDVVEGSLAAA